MLAWHPQRRCLQVSECRPPLNALGVQRLAAVCPTNANNSNTNNNSNTTNNTNTTNNSNRGRRRRKSMMRQLLLLLLLLLMTSSAANSCSTNAS